jgi:hypothetical protein
MVKVSVDHPGGGSEGLGVLPVPSIEETNAITEEKFHASEISTAEFEDLWSSSA